MKKNYFIGLLAVAAIFFASCSNDNDLAKNQFANYKFLGTWSADSTRYTLTEAFRACTRDTFRVSLVKDGSCTYVIGGKTYVGRFSNALGDSTKFHMFVPDSLGKTFSVTVTFKHDTVNVANRYFKVVKE